MGVFLKQVAIHYSKPPYTMFKHGDIDIGKDSNISKGYWQRLLAKTISNDHNM